MLGKPVVGFLRNSEASSDAKLRSLAECPIVNASITPFATCCASLVLDRERRLRLGEASRRFAERWDSADALAERFEAVYDHVLAGGTLRRRRSWFRQMLVTSRREKTESIAL